MRTKEDEERMIAMLLADRCSKEEGQTDAQFTVLKTRRFRARQAVRHHDGELVWTPPLIDLNLLLLHRRLNWKKLTYTTYLNRNAEVTQVLRQLVDPTVRWQK
jgi:hypothetical protein